MVRKECKKTLTATVPCGNEKLAVAHGVLARPLVCLAEAQRSILCPVPGSPVAPSELESRSRGWFPRWHTAAVDEKGLSVSTQQATWAVPRRVYVHGSRPEQSDEDISGQHPATDRHSRVDGPT